MTSLTLGIAACSSSRQAPVISTLVIFPDHLPAVHAPRTVSLRGSLSFSDLEGDLLTLHVRSPFSAVDEPIANPTGASTGTGAQSFSVTLAPGPAVYPFEVWITDRAGLESNRLHADVAVVIDGSCTGGQQIPLGTTAYLRAGVWTGSRFVVVGTEVFTSEDLVTWTPRPSGQHPALNGVAWSGTMLVAVGEQGTVLTSPDGITWTTQTSPEPHSTLWRAVWAGGQFVVTGGAWRSLGPDGWSRAYHDGLVLTSRDGQSWTRAVLALPDRQVTGIASSGGLLVAGTIADGQPVDSLVITSNDGAVWTPRIVRPAPDSSPILDIAWSGSQFVAVSAVGRVFTSPDATTWTLQNSQTTGPVQHAVTWTGSHFISVGWSFASSTDGVTWRSGALASELWGIAWSGLQCVAVGDGVLFVAPSI
jgi:hypothetical protein